VSITSISTPTFCLHTRPYQESSIIAQLFCEKFGRVSAVMKGIKGGSKKNGMVLPLFQPFVPTQITLAGKSELKTVAAIEMNGHPYLLKGQALFTGMYINELLMRLLPEHIECAELYQHYQELLQALMTSDSRVELLELPLRKFEKQLLENLGYGIPFVEVNAAGQYVDSLQNELSYFFIPASGFIRKQAGEAMAGSPMVFQGQYLLQVMDDNIKSPEAALQAKQLIRIVLGQLLGNKPLNSKMLFS